MKVAKKERAQKLVTEATNLAVSKLASPTLEAALEVAKAEAEKALAEVRVALHLVRRGSYHMLLRYIGYDQDTQALYQEGVGGHRQECPEESEGGPLRHSIGQRGM